MFSIHAGRGGIGNYSLLCCFCRRLFVLLSSRFSSIVIALGWERGHDYRSWRRAAYTPVLELNISNSEQPSSSLLWSESGCHTLRRSATQPQCLYYLRRTRMHAHMHAHTCTHWHAQRGSRYKSSLSCIDPASALHFCPSVFQMFQNKVQVIK